MKGRFRQPIWIIPLLIAGLVALVGEFGNTRLRRTIETQLKAELSETLEANVTALNIWMTNQERLAALMSEEQGVRKLSRAILENPPASEPEPRGPPEFLENNEFNNLLRSRLRTVNYDSVALVSTNFMVLATSRLGRMRMPMTPVLEVHTNKFAELFASGKPCIITPYKPAPPPAPPPGSPGDRFGQRFGQPPPGPPPDGEPGDAPTNRPRGFAAMGNGGPGEGRMGPGRRQGPREPGRGRRGDLTLMQVAAPISGEKGGIVGALALIINPDQEFTRMLSVARIGESGETYAFDQHGLLISQSRFDKQLHQLGLLDSTNSSSALNFRLHDPGADLTVGAKARTEETNSALTHIVATAVSGKSGVEVSPSRDYRGVPVVGAWRWLPEHGFGIATQIDASEAYRPLRWLQTVFTLLFLLLVLCGSVMFLFSYRDVVWRQRLDEAELKLKRLGQYTLEQKIGEGGMGVVYRARHALMRRDTAIKLLLPGRADPASVERFEREVCLTCQLSHPNTIQIYDYGHTPEGVFYYVMEYLQGLNLHDLVARFGPQPEGRVIHILNQVCDSLAEAHGMGLVHRDIKPANVFLCERGGVPDCVKVLDFGLVRLYKNGGNKADATPLTAEKAIIGTPWFMAPESIKNSALTDPRSDIYAVGALACFLLTGQYVFQAETVMEIYEKQLTVAPAPPSLRGAGSVSPALDRTILRSLDRDPEKRPQTVGELRRLLATSPHTRDWTLDARGAWWRQNPVQAESPVGAPPGSSIPATIRIQLDSTPESPQASA